ncbi:hypothetical protein Ahia01_000608400, partial [Argonauta hians]
TTTRASSNPSLNNSDSNPNTTISTTIINNIDPSLNKNNINPDNTTPTSTTPTTTNTTRFTTTNTTPITSNTTLNNSRISFGNVARILNTQRINNWERLTNDLSSSPSNESNPNRSSGRRDSLQNAIKYSWEVLLYILLCQILCVYCLSCSIGHIAIIKPENLADYAVIIIDIYIILYSATIIFHLFPFAKRASVFRASVVFQCIICALLQVVTSAVNFGLGHHWVTVSVFFSSLAILFVLFLPILNNL